MIDGKSASRPVVLVVEDQPILLLMAIEMVEDAGFEALEASNSHEALEILERRDDICIVVTDVEMPNGPDGLELAALIRNRWPPINIIIVSGRIRPEKIELPDGCIFHAKPYDNLKVTTDLHRMASG